MSIPKTVTAYLKKKGVRYEVVPHRKVFTAYDLAQTLGERLERVAKALLLKVELPEVRSKGNYYIVAVPASYTVELERVKKALHARRVDIAGEQVMKKLGMVPGALSPFAALHALHLLMDTTLLKSKEIFVRAGSLTESLRVSSKQIHTIEGALAGVFGKKSGVRLQKHTSVKKTARPKTRGLRTKKRTAKKSAR